MSQRCLILSADSWSMPDEKTGVINSGLSVWFVNDYRDDQPAAVGFKPTKVSAPVDSLEALRGVVPCLADVDFGSRPGAQGKATLVMVKIAPVGGQVDLFSQTQKAK